MIRGIKGPGSKDERPIVNAPDCVKIETQKDMDEFKAFIDNILKVARDDWMKTKESK